MPFPSMPQMGNDYPEPADITLEESPPKPLPGMAPFGMTPGVRHELPGITAPEAPAPSLDPAHQPKFAGQYGIEVTDPDTGKKMVFHSNYEGSLQSRSQSIAALGRALMDHAHTDQEKSAAERAAAWGLAQVDTEVPMDQVIKNMDESYQKATGYDAALAKQSLANQGRLDAVRARFPWLHGGVGGGAALGPSKQDKFDAQQNAAVTHELESYVENERKNYDFKANQTTQQALQQAIAGMNSNSALAQRIAVMNELKQLTGKQQTQREQAAIANAAGVIEAWNNDLALKIPGADPQLSEKYRQEFIQALQVALGVSRETLANLGETSVQGLMTSPFYQRMSPEEQDMAARHVYGRMTGMFPPAATRQAPAAPKPTPKSGVRSAKDILGSD